MGLFDFLKKKEKNKFEQKNVSSQESVDNFTKDMISSADFFLKTSSERFKGLDFSVKSLEVVESALDEASEFYEDMNQEQRHNLIKPLDRIFLK